MSALDNWAAAEKRLNQAHETITELRETIASLRSALEEAREAMAGGHDALEWALDMLDMYDKELVRRGDDPERVYSSVHKTGKEIAAAALGDLHRAAVALAKLAAVRKE